MRKLPELALPMFLTVWVAWKVVPALNVVEDLALNSVLVRSGLGASQTAYVELFTTQVVPLAHFWKVLQPVQL